MNQHSDSTSLPFLNSSELGVVKEQFQTLSNGSTETVSPRSAHKAVKVRVSNRNVGISMIAHTPRPKPTSQIKSMRRQIRRLEVECGELIHQKEELVFAQNQLKEALKKLTWNYERLQQLRDEESNKVGLQSQLQNSPRSFVQRNGEVGSLKEQLHKSDENFRQLSIENETLCKNNTSLNGELQDFLSKNSHLRNQIASLEHQLARMKAEKSDLEGQTQNESDRVSHLLSQNAILRAQSEPDGSIGSLSQGELQPDIIRRDFVSFKEQDFEVAAEYLFRHLRDENPELKSQRRMLTARIKSLLVEQVFFEEEKRLEALNAQIRVAKAISTLKGASLKSGIEHIIVQLQEELVNRELPIIGEEGKVNSNSESEFILSVEARVTHILSEIKVTAPLEFETQEQLRQAMHRGHELLLRFQAAKPPGKLWVARKGDTFNAEQHELQAGCNEGSPISLTLFPGYKLGEAVQAKSVVFTSLNIPSLQL